MEAFERVTPVIHDTRLVIEAPSARARRDLFMAIKRSRSPVRAHLHMTPQGKANKTLVYFIARRYPVGIEDRGDIVCLSWREHPEISARVDVGTSAGEVEA
jgi:hypothetical protein